MPSMRFRHVVAALGVLLASATLAIAALPKTAPEPDSASLAGQFLVATPDNGDPRFYHTVILMVLHNKEGAFGIIINRPAGKHPVADLLKAFGADASGVSGDVSIYFGGPVDPGAGFVLHSAEYSRDDTLDIDGRVALTTAPVVLRDIGLGRGPARSIVAFGYAGWGPAQLEDELARGVWVTVPEDPKLVFDDDRANVWTDALALHKTGR